MRGRNKNVAYYDILNKLYVYISLIFNVLDKKLNLNLK